MKKFSLIILGICSLIVFSSGMVQAQHFVYTPTNYGLHSIAIQNATVMGQPLAIGDEIGVFDGSLCVGSVVFAGSYPLQVQAHRATSTPVVLPGYTHGNPISFRVWDDSEGFEMPAQPTYVGGVGTFGGFSVISMLAVSSIPTVSEWGLIVMTLLFLVSGTLILRRRLPLLKKQECI